MTKKPKQYHHVILGLNKKTEEVEEKSFGLNVNRTIKNADVDDEFKAHCRAMLRERLMTNRQFIKDLRAAKKPMMIHEKLMEEKWQLHAASMEKIRSYVRGDVPIIENEEENEVDEEISE